jgi:hypothetical protein
MFALSVESVFPATGQAFQAQRAFPCLALRWPGLAPAGDLLSCFAKKEGKEGDPASPVIRLGE